MGQLDEVFRRLAEIEEEIRISPETSDPDGTIARCRAAVSLVQSWPVGTPVPEVDVDEDGTVTLEQYSPHGTLTAYFAFVRADRAAFTILAGGNVIQRGFVKVDDRRHIIDVMREVQEISDSR